MTARIKRQLARAAERSGSFWERRIWWNDSLRRSEDSPAAMRVALALDAVLANMPVSIDGDEMIVGRHPSSVEPEDAPRHVAMWSDSRVSRMPEEIRAMEAQIYSTGPKTGHLTPNFTRLLNDGIDATIRAIEEETSNPERRAMVIALRSVSKFVLRYEAEANHIAQNEELDRSVELRKIAEVCGHIAHAPARNLHEATQLVWFSYLVQAIEEGEGTAAFALGRFDQYLYPYWRRSLEMGETRDSLAETIAGFWVKLNEFTGLQVINLTIGGSDRQGNDAVNDLSFVCLELMEEFHTQEPSLSVRWHESIDPAFFRKAIRLSAQGLGHPAFYNDEAAIHAMKHAGVEAGDATDVVPGGCVELGVEGCCFPWVGNFFNLPKCLELALRNGIDPENGERVGPSTGSLGELVSFERLFEAYQQQVAYFIHLMVISENTTDRLLAEQSPFPYLSSIVDDCIERGIDINSGGARYNFTEIQAVGIAHVVDSLLHIKTLVFDSGEYSLDSLLGSMSTNFEGDEPLRRRLRTMKPCYGDGTGVSNEMARRVVHHLFDEIDRYTNPRGGVFRPGLLVWTLHEHWADTVGALADGRTRGELLVNSIGPRDSAGIRSPTPIIRSCTSFDHWRCAGGLTLNLRFDQKTVADRAGLDAVRAALEVYFKSGGLQAQINVVSSETMRAAQIDPELYQDLVVRISGFSARFTGLSRRIQDEIIKRTELIPS